ncbi:MAG: SCO family protein [Candidatus Omnitrophota bacterium]|nr:SCO family protein [Candidatus Omnitrophota bacterium]MDZ4242692.1 SCO family protein [Candidatus Omnitrophota bacterium]
MKTNQRTITAGLLLLTATAALITVYFYLIESKSVPLPEIGVVEEFRLTDTTNRPFGTPELKGKVWVVDFIFTTCGSICPVMTKNMASLYRSYELSPDVEFVSISVNPEQDTPEQLAAYAKKYKADTRKWHFLTGGRESIEGLVQNNFKLNSANDPVMHSGYFVLVDRQGRIRGYFDGTDSEKVRDLFKAIAALAREKGA